MLRMIDFAYEKGKIYMKKKRLIVLVSIVLAIVALIAAPIIVKNTKLRNEVKPVVEKWANENGISDYSIKRVTYYGDYYNIEIKWNGFENLTTSEMSKVVHSWDETPYGYRPFYFLDYIFSNGNKYSISNDGIFSYKDMKRIVYFDSYSYSSGSSSSTPSKTATCNYCGGTGRVNGDTCPWCNGSGKTYDNAFNDMFK